MQHQRHNDLSDDDDDEDDEESKEGDQSQLQLNNNHQHENRIEMLLSEMRSDGGSVDLNLQGGQQAPA